MTGAANGIGLAIAQRLAADGLALVMADIDEPALAAAGESIRAEGGVAHTLPTDVRVPAQTDAVVKLAERELGGLHVLVNCAGLIRGGDIEEMTDEEWDLVLDVVLRGTFNAIRSAAPLLLARSAPPPTGHRKVITISSVAGIHGGTAVNYSAAKAGQIGLSRSLARTWAPEHINVNVVAPGRIAATRISDPRDAQHRALGPPPSLESEADMGIPIGRSGTPAEVAELVSFLASPASDFITGQVIEIHGGLEVMPRPRP